MQYTITKSAKNPMDSTIQKLGVVVNFSMQEILDHTVALKKLLTELTAKQAYEKAKMTNIEENHAFVLDMSEQDMFTCHMYQEAKAIVLVAGTKIAEVEKQLSEYETEKAEIFEQLPELVAEEPVEAEIDSESVAEEALEETTTL